MASSMNKLNAKYYTTRESFSDLLKELFSEADRQTDLAYAPYSNFRVGAAVLDQEGNIFGGSNQENASYPLCMCAERVALYHCISAYQEVKVVAMALAAKSNRGSMDDFVSPCGACRQVMVEYEKRFGIPMKLYLLHVNGGVLELDSVSNLLPLSFDSKVM